MKRRMIFLLALTAALVLSLQISVLAVDQAEWIGPVVDALQDPPVYYAQSSETPYWDSDADSYGDVLEGIAKQIYDELERRFAAYEAGTYEIPLRQIGFSTGVEDAWVFERVLEQTITSSQWDSWRKEVEGAADSALRAFVYDYPEYFWVRESYGMGWGRAGNQAYVNAYYIAQEGFDDMEEQHEALWDTVDMLVTAVEGLSDAQKIAWWDNWLAVNNRYNGAALAKNYINTDATPWCVIGALLDGYQPVCEGYAKALQLLCHQAGIPCVQQSGVANGGGHMWAAVKLDGQWYFCDPTWDDPNTDEDSWNYSTREYLLTPQPGSHNNWSEPVLGRPRIVSSAYIQPMSKDFGWMASGNTPVGYEIGSGTMLIALYDEDGRFLTMGTCSSIQWDWTDYIYLAPNFSEAVLEQTGSIVRFNLNNTVNWAPAATAKPIQ
ncbi:MAG: hypothetical protein IKU58_01370 [Clostridia bacterium]|nr:hypothetical protein [Clostridia bacterium]